MNGNVQEIVFVTGSNKQQASTSESMADYLIQKLSPQQIMCEKYSARRVIEDQNSLILLTESIQDCEIVVLISPLYVDSLPYPLTRLLEKLADYQARTALEGKKMVSIIHSGYPEPVQRQTCIDICRCFAEETGMSWLGGIGFGLTSPIDGQPLENVGRMAKWIRASLDEVASSLSTGNSITKRAETLSHKKFLPIPISLLKTLVNIMTSRQIKQGKVENAFDTPYA